MNNGPSSRKIAGEFCISAPSAGMTRIRFVGLATTASQPGDCRTPHEIAAQYLVREAFEGKNDLQAGRVFARLRGTIKMAAGGAR